MVHDILLHLDTFVDDFTFISYSKPHLHTTSVLKIIVTKHLRRIQRLLFTYVYKYIFTLHVQNRTI